MPSLAGLHPTLKSSTDHFALKVQGYLWLLGFQAVEWEAEPSAISLPFCGTSTQFGFRRQTPSLFSRLGSNRCSWADRGREKLHSGPFLLASEHRVAVRGRIHALVSMWAERQAATGALCSESNYNGNEITVRDLTAAVSAPAEEMGGCGEER